MKKQNGFNLIEVALALVIVGIGFTALLQIFPHALRAGRIAREESAQTLFANALFSRLSQKAMETTIWDDWKEDDWIKDVCDFKLWQKTAAPLSVATSRHEHIKEFHKLGVGSYLVVVKRSPNKKTVSVTLWSTHHDVGQIDDGQVAAGTDAAKVKLALVKLGVAFHTELYYMGRPE